MFLIRLIAFWCLLALSTSLAHAQRVDFQTIPEDTRPLLTVFLGTDQRSMEFENELLQWEGFSNILSQVNFRKMTSADAIYQERWGQVIPSNRFPAVMLQDTDGGVVYLVSGQDMPPPKDMATQMKSLWSAYAKAKNDAKTQLPATNPIDWESGNPNCPDGTCPPTAQPQERIVIPTLFDTLARRPTPIIDSITGVVWAIGLAVIGACMLLFFFAVFAVVLLVITRKK